MLLHEQAVQVYCMAEKYLLLIKQFHLLNVLNSDISHSADIFRLCYLMS